MTAQSTSNAVTAMLINLVDLIKQGNVNGLARFVVEPFDDGSSWGIRTVALINRKNSAFPVTVIDLHEDDEAAMVFALTVFDELKAQGKASVHDIAGWRRALFTLVPDVAEAS